MFIAQGMDSLHSQLQVHKKKRQRGISFVAFLAGVIESFAASQAVHLSAHRFLW